MKTNLFRWLAETILALLIMVSALPASAQEEIDIFNWQFNSMEADDGSGWIISPNKYDGYDWDHEINLIVPATHPGNGRPIVGLDGFSYLGWLHTIEFEEGSQLKSIGNNCFEGCTGIEFIINLPETVETIGAYAFYGCTMLYDLTLPSNLKNIGVSAFEQCTSLQSITLPKSLKLLREWAFRNCTGLKTVVFEDEVDFYTNGVYCFYNSVFDGCTSLSSVTLPKNTPGYFYIPMGTFRWCGNLKSIEFPANTRRIEGYAFNHSGLESLDLTTIDCDECFLTGYYTFAECNSLKTVKAKGNLRFDDTCLSHSNGAKLSKLLPLPVPETTISHFPPMLSDIATA